MPADNRGDYEETSQEEDIQATNEEEGDLQIQDMTDGCTACAGSLLPKGKVLSDDSSRVKLLKDWGTRYTALYFGAIIAIPISVGVIPKINRTQIIEAHVDQVSPPENITAFADNFRSEEITVGAGIPITVLLSVVAGLMFAYYALRYFYFTKTKVMIERSEDGWRWAFLAPCKALTWIVLFSINGQTDLNTLLLLGSVAVFACGLLYLLDHVTRQACSEKAKLYKCVGDKESVSNTCAVIVVGAAVLATAFILSLCYNGHNTPQWVFAFSITHVIWEAFLITMWLGFSYKGSQNTATHQSHFVRGVLLWNHFNFLTFGAYWVTILYFMAHS
jgi:hypothetical protein